MRILAFRHVSFEGVGLIADALSGVEIDYADLYEGAGPDPADYAALIFLGGPMSVNDDLPFIQQEVEIIRQAVARRQPVLGICLGGQLIAKAMGARVARNRVSEIGWFPIRLTEAGKSDALLGGLETPMEVFHWHGETFALPPGAVHLAWSEACANQAFRIGDLLYALQFHPEVSPEMIADWCTQDANCGDVRELTAPIDAQRNREGMVILSRHIFGRWLVLVQSAALTE
jgi:GMP synthase (glutamine-hydrolysing)